MIRSCLRISLLTSCVWGLAALPAAAQVQQTVTMRVAAPVFLTPTDNQQPLRVAKEGSIIRLLGTEGEWYHVEFEDPQYGRRIGYVKKSSAVLNVPDYSRIPPMDLSVRDQPHDAERNQPPVEVSAQGVQRSAARAQSIRHGIRQGTTELLFSASLNAVNGGGDTATVAELESTIGYFATPRLEFGGDFSVLKVSDVDPVGTAAGLFAYNFNPDAAAVGFAGGAVGGGFGAGDLNPFFFEVFGGIRVLTPGGGGAFVVRPFYERQSFGHGANANVFGVALGVSILF